MGDIDSYDIIEEWMNQNGIITEFVPYACAEFLEAIILEIINPTASDVLLPSELETVVSETEVGGDELSEADQELLRDFQADSLYTDKWAEKSDDFQNLMLKSWAIEVLALLLQMCDTLDPNTNGTTITAFRPSVRQIRLKLRNYYVKLHPNQYVGIFPYETFVPDWANGEN